MRVRSVKPRDSPKRFREPGNPSPVPKDLDSILALVDAIAREIVAADADKVDRDARWPERGIRALQAARLGGLVVPHVYGGCGQGLLALVQICEILGKECASTAICFGMHCVGASVIARNANEYQQERYLAPINEGRHITTLSFSEPGTGAHFYYPQSRLLPAGPDEFVLNGAKHLATNGGYADSYVVSAATVDPQSPAGGFSCVVVPADSDGFEVGPVWDGLGLRGNSSRTLTLNAVRVPRRDLLGNEGDQIWYLFNVICPTFLSAMSGTYLGVSSAVLEAACGYLKERRHSHSATSLSQISIIQHRMGELWSIVERTRRLIYFAASSFDAGQPTALTAVMAAKAEVADCVNTLVGEVMTLMGGITYRSNSKLHRSMRDARAAHLMAPTTDMLRLWIGRTVLGQPLLVD